ncbi:alpha-L-fucosidase [Halomontanus rarus]|uniref:alpha-L-fucosidase n=1 Tax=Halomontanus rarus TaxID=3034020 RepID=UPI001A98A0FB
MHSDTDERRLRWFTEASLGLFVHWGLSSVAGDVEISWGLVQNKPWTGDDDPDKVVEDLPGSEMDAEEYWTLADDFDPDAYDPDRWLAAARRAGMEYAVLTAKHHDGFALWPTDHGDFGVDEHLDGRDLVGEFVDACRRQGLKAGLYFSLPDWHHPDFPRPVQHNELATTNPAAFEPDAANRSEPPSLTEEELVSFESYYRDTKAQVEELVTDYGIDLLWFDLPVWPESLDHRLEAIYEMAWSANPELVINGRSHGYDVLGDYYTPENELPERPLDKPWEVCQLWAAPAWSYHVDEEYRDLSWLLPRFATTVGWGGNMLLNVGPKSDGSLPEGAYEQLENLERWMSHSEPAVTDVDKGPWPERADVPITRRNGIWYLHVLESTDEEVVVTGVPKPVSVRSLRTHSELTSTYDDRELVVSVPHEERESPNEVVVVRWPSSHTHLL